MSLRIYSQANIIHSMKKLSSLSIVFPAYNDEKTIGDLVKKAKKIVSQYTNDFEIIVVNDGSTDGTKNVLKKIENRSLRVITHRRNAGYGAALAIGFQAARKAFIFYTDGDGQYDVSEIKKLIAAFDPNVDIVTGFKIERSDSWLRKVIGTFYNYVVKMVFRLKVKDVDCDCRLFRRESLRGITFRIKSGAFDVEFIGKLQQRGARFKEVPIHHYPRVYGSSQFFNFRHIGRSLLDLVRLLITYGSKKTYTIR